MVISFELPEEIGEEIRKAGMDPNAEAREAFLVELYRSKRITHFQLSQALGLERFETEAVLKRHEVGYGITLEEYQAEAASLREAREAEKVNPMDEQFERISTKYGQALRDLAK